MLGNFIRGNLLITNNADFKIYRGVDASAGNPDRIEIKRETSCKRDYINIDAARFFHVAFPRMIASRGAIKYE